MKIEKTVEVTLGGCELGEFRQQVDALVKKYGEDAYIDPEIGSFDGDYIIFIEEEETEQERKARRRIERQLLQTKLDNALRCQEDWTNIVEATKKELEEWSDE